MHAAARIACDSWPACLFTYYGERGYIDN